MNTQDKLERFYTSLDEPLKATLLYLREHILSSDPRLCESWKYGMPFFCVGKKMFCYFWFDQQDRSRPYLSFADGYRIDHSALEQGSRKRFKIFRFDPATDLDIPSLNEILTKALIFYKDPSIL